MAMTAREQFQGWHLAVSTILMIAGLLGLDRLVAVYFHESGHQGAWLFVQGTILFDTVTGKDISKFLPGLVLIAAALVMLAVPRSRRLGWSTLFVGSVQLLGTLVTGVAKNFFDRLRPFQVLERGDWSHVWFMDGTAFPSGHAGYYFGLFLPLAWLFPRWRWPLILAPWFIAIARVNANDHFVSDVAASMVIVGLLTLLMARVTRQR